MKSMPGNDQLRTRELNRWKTTSQTWVRACILLNEWTTLARKSEIGITKDDFSFQNGIPVRNQKDKGVILAFRAEFKSEIRMARRYTHPSSLHPQSQGGYWSCHLKWVLCKVTSTILTQNYAPFDYKLTICKNLLQRYTIHGKFNTGNTQ